MNFVSYLTGAMTVLLAYAMFKSHEEEETELIEGETESSLAVSDFTGRYVTLSCQTCRKLKKHKEISPNVFQCVKCKRHVDVS